MPLKAPTPSATPQHAKIWLTSQDAAGLAAAAKAVSDPKSSQFRHYLSADQVRAQYAPTSAQVAAITSWATDAGLHIDRVGPNNFFVAVSGTTAAMNSAFTTKLGQYMVNKVVEQAPTTDLTVPSALADKIITVTGLATLGHRTHPTIVKPNDFGPPGGFVNSNTCSDAYGTWISTGLPKFKGKQLPYSICGYTPPQLRGAYGVDQLGDPGELGTGQYVAITDAYDSPNLLSDANTYADNNDNGMSFANDYGSFTDNSVAEDGSTEGDCGGNGWYGEQALDIEAVHAMAPNANVLYYGAASCFDDDLMAQLAQIAADDSASIVTNSWGQPLYFMYLGVRYPTVDAALVAAYDNIFETGALEGIGYNFSSGDDGDEVANTGWKSPDYPASDEWITAVGGTSLAAGADNQRVFESGWGTAKYSLVTPVAAPNNAKPKPKAAFWELVAPFQYGAGGGYTDTKLFTQPYYQDGIVKGNKSGGRAVPDIAMDADPTTGMLIGQTQDFSLDTEFGSAGTNYGEFRIGGTSLASPLLAGLNAAVQGDFGAFFDSGFGWVGTIGFANPWSTCSRKAASTT